jgi:predicted aspartyl protease
VSIVTGARERQHRARLRKRMGAFRVDIEICRPGRHPRWVRVPQVLVDSGAEMSWLPERLLRSIGIEVFKRDQRFVMANGNEITRDIGIAVIRSGDFKTVDEVVFGRAGDLALLGARTLEGFNARIDPRRKRLVAGGPAPAAVAASESWRELEVGGRGAAC